MTAPVRAGVEPEARFEFGRNWRVFSAQIDEARVAEATQALRRLLGVESLAGRSFLDVGCGSGLHALAALRLGADRVEAVDLDPEAVATARDTLSRHAEGASWAVRQRDAFALSPETDGRFDVVYSWGVLHHSGDLWRAVGRVAALVRPGGLLVIALYKRTPLCGFWTWEKRLFVRSGPARRRILVALFVAARALRDLVRGRNPWARLRAHRAQRGMYWYTDAVDWLGGLPYESASPEEVGRFVEPLGFRLEASFHTRASWGVIGTGNAEYRFRRDGRDGEVA